MGNPYIGSQYGEHEHILRYFGEYLGRFLDIGAHDGKIFSNSWPLADRGWSGVAVEPSSWVFPYLADNYTGNDRVELVNAAITSKPGLLDWWDCKGDCFSTLEQAHRDKIADQRFTRMSIAGVSVEQLLARFPGEFDFVNIDVEGNNLDVLAAIGARLRPRMICVELDPEAPITAEVARLFPDYQTQKIGGNLLAWRTA